MFFFCLLSPLTPVGGGVLHGVFLDLGGNGAPLTQHIACGVGRHVASHSPVGTDLTRLSNNNDDSHGGEVGGQNTGQAAPLDEGKLGKRASQWAPEIQSTKQVAQSSNALLKPDCIQKQSAAELADTRKSSVEREKTGERKKGRRGSGETMEEEKNVIEWA